MIFLAWFWRTFLAHHDGARFGKGFLFLFLSWKYDACPHHVLTISKWDCTCPHNISKQEGKQLLSYVAKYFPRLLLCSCRIRQLVCLGIDGDRPGGLRLLLCLRAVWPVFRSSPTTTLFPSHASEMASVHTRGHRRRELVKVFSFEGSFRATKNSGKGKK